MVVGKQPRSTVQRSTIFCFAKYLEEKRKDVDEEHRWELQLVDRSSSCGGSGKAASLHSSTEEQCLIRTHTQQSTIF